MRRFPPRDQPPRPPRERKPREPKPREPARPGGPFDRILQPRPGRDPAPFIIGGTVAFLVLVILILFVAPFSPLAGGDGDGEEIPISDTGIVAKLQGSVPPLPPSLIAVSPFYAIQSSDGAIGSAVITIRLLQRVSEGANLGFYTFEENHWRRVASATLEKDGSQASAEFPQLPDNLAVLRVIAQAFQVAGSLPAEAGLHPDAQGLLNIASPRDYTPESDGSITGQTTPLDLGEGTILMPTILGSDEASSAAVADILSDAAVRQAHIDAIVQLASDGGFAGIDLEYTRLEASARSQFREFVRDLAERLHRDGRKLSLTLPPVGSDGGEGAYDWQGLGKAADIIKILSVADPTRYWEEIPKALDFAVANVDTKKLFLVVDPTSVRQEDSRVSAIGYQEAMLLATQLQIRSPSGLEEIMPNTRVSIEATNLQQGAGIDWSDEARSIHFSFEGDAGRTTVFVENGFSVGFKLELVQIYRLQGVWIADASANADVANIWPTVKELVDSGTAPLERPNLDSLSPDWFAPDGGDLLPQGAIVEWTAPSQGGTFTIEFVASDGIQRFGRRLSIEVVAEPTPTPTPVPTATETPPELETPTANNPPEANDDAAATAAATSVTIDVLANDLDPDGDPLAIVAVSVASGGSVSIGAGGSTISYTPDAGTSEDSFTYTVSDGDLTDTATVTVTVTP